jgi:pimeloyl-ACP methyl ester carboxylesterase
MPSSPTPLRLQGAGGVQLDGEERGEGPPIVLLHGLTSTRRYVVMGSSGLERAGRRTIAYDARGHGQSDPAPNPADYSYDSLAADLLVVLDQLGLERAVIAGASMGAHTAIRFALSHPQRVAGLGLITPAHDPATYDEPAKLASWDALAEGLRHDGVEGFVHAYDFEAVPERWRDTVEKVVRQRLELQAHPLALADALQTVPRSQPFEDWEQLASLQAPTLVVASRDEADPTHPLAVAERYAATIPGAELAVERPGSSPIAWQGGQLSRLLAQLG